MQETEGEMCAETDRVLPRSFAGMADHEGLMGARRVRAAMPPVIWKLFPEIKNEPLEEAEARYHGLEVKVMGDTVVEFVGSKNSAV